MTRSTVVIVFACSIFCVGAAEQHEHMSMQPEQMGRVQFSNSCSASVQAEFNLAVASLHSFAYRNAAERFASVAQKDPSCGIAEWGVAMSHYRQLWDPPTADDLKAGWEAVQKGKEMGLRTQRERDYIEAIEMIYKDPGTQSHRTRALAYEHAMDALRTRHPEDREAAIFYALAVLADAPASDQTYANQRKAALILEPIFAEQPEHPGLAHYIIHCDDHPGLAQQALDAARRYAKIAPDAPHALHMPSHIFTRLGLWDESIQSNLASAACARKQDLSGDELHALDYLVYAYLQTGRVGEAAELVRELPRVQPGDAAYYAGLYATAAIPARYAVERHQWTEAEALRLPPNTFPGGAYAWCESNFYFARALGAARLGHAAAARAAIRSLESLRDTLLRTGDNYSADQVTIQMEAVTAWITLADGDKATALRQMRAAADHEDATDKAAVTPGAIVPARELLGEMLLQVKEPNLAFEAFVDVLRVSPERFGALHGAALSARDAGLDTKAEFYYRKLRKNCQQGDPTLPEILDATSFLDKR